MMESLGQHILVEFTGCSAEMLDDVQAIEEHMVQAAEQSSATVINATFHHFSPLGVSGVVVIQESHLAIHTWPEYRYAAVDLFTCGGTVKPWIAFDYLKSALKARNYSALEMRRGTLHLLDPELKLSDVRIETQQKVTPRFKRNIWFTDRDKGQALSLRYTGEVLLDEQSDYNRIRIIETYAYGKALTSGNRIICTEKDEYHYHEMIAHPVLHICNTIKKVLIIGGGDGGSAREVLQYSQIEQVDLVEIDKLVVEASKRYLPFLSVAYRDKRLNLIIDDALEFVKNVKAGAYDFIIIDGPHSSGQLSPLYSRSFFDYCKKILSAEGAMVVQGESPKFSEKDFVTIDRNLKHVFGNSRKHTILFNVPTFPSGIWSFQLILPENRDPLNIDKQKIELFAAQKHTKYYNYATHMAGFALPEYVNKMLQ
ncbi:MAG: polyamine aminopropyltransferase [Salinivirgaceae bacterium]|jgi:spermidine synthase|nr:polyamine aminopropyltransferase [Salinivirgaceae bacterium]